jgi:medium-chain acyl-[acyl-carrier-protein] hydrolase
LLAVELPGRGGRIAEQPLESMADITQGLMEAIKPMLNTPFALFGHSMGGLIAFELARRLRNAGLPEPTLLIASGCRAPHTPRLKATSFDLPELEFKARLRELNDSASAVLEDPELMALLMPALRADFYIVDTYAFELSADDRLKCPVLALGGIEDDEVSAEAVAAWRAVTTGPFSMEFFPGDHFFIYSARDAVLERLHRELMSIAPAIGLEF